MKLAIVVLQPMMANLPPAYILPCRTIAKIGVNYAGPLNMREYKLWKARVYKIYIASSICMTVKTVHLEIVSDLSSDIFLGALNHFVARRGLPSDIYSNYGTNFIVASKRLSQLFALQKTQHESSSQLPCSWHFKPLSTFYSDSLWEAAIHYMYYITCLDFLKKTFFILSLLSLN